MLYKPLRGATSVDPLNPFPPTSEWGLERCTDFWVWSSTVRHETSNMQCPTQRHALLINGLIVSVHVKSISGCREIRLQDAVGLVAHRGTLSEL